MKTLKLIFPVLFILIFGISYSQKKEMEVFASLEGIVSSKDELPFFLRANQFDRIPNNDTFGYIVGIHTPFNQPSADFDYAFKGSFSSYGGINPKTQFNELYGSLRYKMFYLEVGSKFSDVNFKGLSISNGSFAKSLNSRAFPGINIKTEGFVKLKPWFAFKGNYGEYYLNDPRYTDNTIVHNKSLHFRFYPHQNWSFNFGLDHYAQWAGNSPVFGNLPATLKDYIRVNLGLNGDANSNDNERINALGNHLGNHLFEITYEKNILLNLYWSHPYEDGSGVSIGNNRDGLFGAFLDLKKSNRIVQNLLFEYVNTLDQGRKNSAYGYIDNYFNNGVYRSGWTYFDSFIGLPLFRSTEIEWEGENYKMNDINYSRMESYHIGISGQFSENFSYKSILNYTKYPGWFNKPLNQRQLSGIISLLYSNPKLPFEISTSFAADFESASSKPYGISLKLISKGIF